MQVRSKKDTATADATWQRLVTLWRLVSDTFSETVSGLRAGTYPLNLSICIGTFFLACVALNLHFKFHWHWVQVFNLPHKTALRWIVISLWSLSGFGLASLALVGRRRRLLRRLTEAFHGIGLKNNLGRPPALISDLPLDRVSRRLSLARSYLSLDQFRSSKDALEGALKIFIDEISEDRERGAVNIIYSHFPMPKEVACGDFKELSERAFYVGKTRGGWTTSSFRDVPHLLIAGQTGGGKSTFLRQMICGLYLRTQGVSLTLIDLKGGLEFSLFDDLPRIDVVPSAQLAVHVLTEIEVMMKARMAALAELKCKDIQAVRKLLAKSKGDVSLPDGVEMTPHIVVIDEATELFLTSPGQNPGEAQAARAVTSRLTRLGRAVGIHLVIGTQRPDARALDTQIKANLPGKLCFPMADTASSNIVLNNTRARDLPAIPGRAIWQAGLTQIELQTPLLSPEEAEKILAPFRIDRSNKATKSTGGNIKRQQN